MLDNEKLVTENFGLVRACVTKFLGRGIEYDDLFQIGCIGLIKAAQGFDESRGLMFSTYAVPTIIGEIKRVFRDTGAIKVSRSLKELSFKVAKAREYLEKEKGEEPSVSEIAKILETDEESVKDAICILQPVASLTYSDDGENKQIELPTESEEENINNKIFLETLLSKLEENDRKLIMLRYFYYKTQSETASIMNMSQVQVSRSEKRILSKLRASCSGE
ncbi:MAG: sigma-70 family RNA polymerase sigma factor [Acutalibacteraceae bacterium]|nr:sigma-70 family RNA polymerase sigma factor [Acutalibacteraceae bacterium]